MDALNVPIYSAYEFEPWIIQKAQNAIFFSLTLEQHYTCMYSLEDEKLYIEPRFADCFDDECMSLIMGLIKQLDQLTRYPMDERTMVKQNLMLQHVKKYFLSMKD